MQARDRIIELRRVPAKQLAPNPRNWRRHPQAQHAALRGVLEEVGIAGAVLARQREDGVLELIDGHLRAATLGDQEIPVLVLDVTEEEALQILATHDPLAAMAEADPAILDDLLREVQSSNEAVAAMLDELRDSAGVFEAEETPPPKLSDGDRQPFRQMSFVLHDDQHATVEAAIEKARELGAGESEINENGNGNAIAHICEVFLNGNG